MMTYAMSTNGHWRPLHPAQHNNEAAANPYARSSLALGDRRRSRGIPFMSRPWQLNYPDRSKVLMVDDRDHK